MSLELVRQRRLLDCRNEEELRAHLQAALEEWDCPAGCGAKVAAPRGAKVADRRCWDCIRASLGPQKKPGGERRAALKAAGCQERFLQPFLERAWPAPRCMAGGKLVKIPEALSPADWRGEPWACGFVGASRSGKTMLATELFWRILSGCSPRTALWARADAVMDSGFSRDADRALFQRAREVRLLLLDDLGWGGGFERLLGLVAQRHGDMLPTIWTGNLDVAQLAASPGGQPLVRRLAEDGWVCGMNRRWEG